MCFAAKHLIVIVIILVAFNVRSVSSVRVERKIQDFGDYSLEEVPIDGVTGDEGIDVDIEAMHESGDESLAPTPSEDSDAILQQPEQREAVDPNANQSVETLVDNNNHSNDNNTGPESSESEENNQLDPNITTMTTTTTTTTTAPSTTRPSEKPSNIASVWPVIAIAVIFVVFVVFGLIWYLNH